MSGRKKPHEAHANHERWLVSYADFITLMFAFFVVMFATSQADQAKTSAVSQAVEAALYDEQFASKVKAALGQPQKMKSTVNSMSLKEGTKAPGKMAELTPSMKKLTEDLADDIRTGRVELNLEPRGLVISLKEGAFFAPGEDTLAPERYQTLAKLADVLKPLANPVRLEGHTDSQPIHNSRFRSNWDLSAFRSIAVLVMLRDRFGVAEQRMAIVGYADTIAMDTNDTEQGRERNRRVDITILSEAAASQEARPVSHKL
jgi:chemotaxis protein MotB